jgi:hypothetical protein
MRGFKLELLALEILLQQLAELIIIIDEQH